MILLVPGNWLLSAAAAACIHEAGHILSLLLLGGKVRSIRLGPFGAVIEGEGVRGAGAVLCTLAGPLCSLLTVLLIRLFPMLAVCGFVQGCFNLLPIFPLDGGRLLEFLMERVLPFSGTGLCSAVERPLFVILLFLVGWGSIRFRWGVVPVLLLLLSAWKAGMRKRP